MEIGTLDNSDVEAVAVEVADIYRAAWEPTEFFTGLDDVAGFGSRLSAHASNPGFKLCIARDETAVGFAYGYASVSSGWWRRTVTSGMVAAEADRLFADCFEFAELAVVPDRQNRGLGSSLHDSLIDGLTHRTAMLSTQKANAKAIRFYLSRGWSLVRSDFTFSSRPYPYVIMGLEVSPTH